MEPTLSEPRFQPVWLHASLRAERQAARRLDGLRQGAIDHFFHYVSARQSQLWLAVHQQHAPVSADPAFAAIFHRAFGSLAAGLAGQTLQLIALGPGGGRKEAWLLHALNQADCRLHYLPVDASAELALTSAAAAAPWIDADALRPVVGDLSLLSELPSWLDQRIDTAPRVYTAFGIAPNFEPQPLFSALQQALRPGDHLLLSANLVCVPEASTEPGASLRAARAILPQYDNPATRLWLRQVLIDWGLDPHLDEICFDIEALAGQAAVVARCRWRHDLGFDCEGETLRFRAGSSLRLFFSLRYTPARLVSLAQEYGFTCLNEQLTPCGQEGVWHLRRHASA